MGLLDKLKSGEGRAAAAVAPAAGPPAVSRVSNGLKDFLWLLSDVRQGQLLDLGPVSQATVSFFTGRGFKVHSDELLRSWKEFLRTKDDALRKQPVGEPMAADPAALAEEFLSRELRFEAESLHAILAWDLFDYLEAELLPRVVNRLYEVLRPGGVLLALFHDRAPEQYYRYRVLDAQTIEMVPAMAPGPPQRFLQNRDILNLFSAFKSSKTYVSRDRNREGLFTK